MTQRRGGVALTYGGIGDYLDKRIEHWKNIRASADAARATPRANEARHSLAELEEVRFALLGSDGSE